MAAQPHGLRLRGRNYTRRWVYPVPVCVHMVSTIVQRGRAGNVGLTYQGCLFGWSLRRLADSALSARTATANVCKRNEYGGSILSEK